jgi:trimeric autotransporter adhesin
MVLLCFRRLKSPVRFGEAPQYFNTFIIDFFIIFILSSNKVMKIFTRSFIRLMAFLLLLTTQLTTWGQVTTNGSSGLAATYPTLDAAITALNGATITAPVTITLQTGNPQTAPSGGYAITATGTAANTVSIVGAGSGSIVTASAAQVAGTVTDAVFKIIGGDYITLSNFTMQENAANTTAAVATNNMTEWGVALLYATVTNGAQNNTIQGCTISLNRTYLNTCGIYSNTRHSATLATTAAEVTSAAGSNSNNKIYTNTISNVNTGIAFIGAGTTLAAIDSGNDIGGSSAATGNTLRDWGGGAAPTAYISLTANVGIFTNQQINDNISYNSVTSASGLAITTTAMTGIIRSYTVAVPAATTVSTATFNNNTVSVSAAPTTAQVAGIIISSATGTSAATTISVNNNTITGSITGTAATSAAFVGILGTTGPGTLNINGNTVSGVTTTATTGAFIGIQQQTNGVVNVLNINNNKIGDATSSAITFSTAANSGGVVGLAVTSTGAAATCALTMTGNDVRGIVHTVVGSGANTYITNASATLSQNISNNTFTNLNINTTASVTFISNSVTVPANGTQTVSNNSIVTAFNKAGAGGTITLCTSSFASSVAGATINHTNNNFSNITVTGATTIAGWSSTDGTTANKTYSANTFSNWTGGTSGITVMNINYGGGNGGNGNVLSNNTITNITGQGAITGISLGALATTQTVTNNTITGLTSTGTGGAVTGITSAAQTGNVFGNTIGGLSTTGAFSVNGIVVSASATASTVYKNKIYNLEASNAAGTANGLSITGGLLVTGYNNLIGDIRTPNATAATAAAANSLTGINVSGGTTVNLYNNTVSLSGTSAGALFGSSGISVSTTPSVTLTNNLVVNNCVATGAGVIAAHRRSSTTLTTYGSASNNNSFYAPTIYTDGTTPITTLAAYKGIMTPRDLSSYSENPTFVSTVGTNAGFLHIPASATLNPLESGGLTLAAVTQDFDGDARPGPAGSTNGGGTSHDVGADEFDGAPSTPSIRLVTPTPAATTQCAATARVITTAITPNTGTTASVTLTYSFNGAAPTSIPMTNSSGNNWTGTIPAPTPTNAMVTWGISATNTTPYTSTYLGTTYSDDPTNGLTTSARATPTSICAGDTSVLTLTSSKVGTVPVGTSTILSSSSSYPTAFGTYRFQDWQQYIIRASELTASGLAAGNITALSFNIAALPNTTPLLYSIKMGHTSLTAATTTFVTTGLTEVYAAATQTPVVGNNTLTLSTPFNWDGVSNIMIDIQETGNNGSANATTYVNTTAFNSVAFAFATTNNTAFFTSNPTATLSTTRPNIVFSGNKAQAVSAYVWNNGAANVGTTNPLKLSVAATTTFTGTATIEGGCTVSATAIVNASPLPTMPIATNSSQCGTAVPTAAVASAAGAAGAGTFKWYAAATGGVALQSSTSTTYTTAIGTTTTFYVSETGTNGCESARTPVTVTITAAPALTITAGATVCSNDIFAITPTSTLANFNSYTWSPNTNLFTDAAATTPYTTGSFTTIYLKSSTAGANVVNCNSMNSATGCANTAAVTVNVLPTTITATSGTTTPLCVSGSTTVSIAAIPVGATVQWQSSTNNSTWTDMPSATTASVSTGTITATTYYRASINKTGGVNCIYSNVLTVTVNNPSVGTRNNATRCGVGTTTLSVTGNNGAVNWYANASGGSPLAGGVNTTTFVTPSISATTTYYVDAQQAGSATPGGARVAPAATANTTPATYGIVFDAITDFTLNAVDVFLASTATTPDLVVVLQNSAGTELQRTTVTVPAGDATTPVKYTLNLGWLIPSGTGYRLLAVSGPSMVRESSLGGFPYAIGTSATATSGYISGTSTTYYYFYNWNTTGVCAAPRLAVTATVTAPPALTLSAATALSCSGAASNAVNVTSTVGNYDSYTWSPATNVTGTTSATFNPATTTTYTLTANNSATSCSNVATVNVTASTNPATPGVTPRSATVCAGAIRTLTAAGSNVAGSGTIGTGTLTTNNTSTPYRNWYGGSKTQYLYTAAELTALGMKPGSLISSVSFNVLAYVQSTTELLYKGHTVAMKLTTSTALTTTLETGTTTVIPPSDFALTGTAPFVSKETFTTPFAWDGTSNLLVETCFNNNSSGGGVSANSATVASTSTGTSLYTSYASYDNTPALCSAPGVATTTTTRPDITFEFNVPATYVWSPIANLFTNAAATTPYTGGDAPTIYAKPLVTQVYTVTASNPEGCIATATSSLTATTSNMAIATGNWMTGATWSCGSSPVSTSNVTIPTGFMVTLDAANGMVNDLTFTGGGKLQLGANNLTVNGTLTADAAVGYVVTNGAGKLRQAIAAGATKTFPIGGSSTTYSPVVATPTTATTFGASVSNTIDPTHTIVPTAAALVGSREWDFSSSTPSATTLALTPNDGRTNPTGSVKFAQWNGTRWLDVAASFAAGTWTGTTSAFLPTILADASLVIPVEFQSISAKAKGTINVIDWSTASEKDVKEFAIERSINNKTWTVIGTEKATGGTAPAAYSFNDNAPTALAYYRIRSIETSGKDQVSKVVAVKRDGGKLVLIMVSPMPTTEGVNVDFAVGKSGKINLIVTDIVGRIIKTETFTTIEGANTVRLDLSQLAQGTYIMSINDGESNATQRIVKQ